MKPSPLDRCALCSRPRTEDMPPMLRYVLGPLSGSLCTACAAPVDEAVTRAVNLRMRELHGRPIQLPHVQRIAKRLQRRLLTVGLDVPREQVLERVRRALRERRGHLRPVGRDPAFERDLLAVMLREALDDARKVS